MWTDGENAVYMAHPDDLESNDHRKFNYGNKNVSEGIVMFDYYLQPEQTSKRKMERDE